MENVKAVVVVTEKTEGTGSRSGLVSYRITVYAEEGMIPFTQFGFGPYPTVPEYAVVRLRNLLLEQLAENFDSVKTVGNI